MKHRNLPRSVSKRGTKSSRTILTTVVACVMLLSSLLMLFPISSNLAHGALDRTIKQSTHSLTPSPAISSPLTFNTFSQGSFAQGLSFVGGIGYSNQANRIIVSARNGTLYQLDASGTANYFAPGFVADHICTTCNELSETYFAISPGLGGFNSGDIFAGSGNGPSIAKISADGSTVTYDWTSCAGASPTSAESGALQGGLAFDTVGTFNFDLLALSTNGLLFQVTANGACSAVVEQPLSLHLPSYSTDYVEGLQVAPSGFGPLGGQAIIGGGTLGYLIAVSNTGAVTTPVGGFTALGDLEAPIFVPSQGGTLFDAIGAVYLASASSFSPSDYGSLIVGGESPTSTYQVGFNTTSNTYVLGTIGTMTWEGAAFAPATFLSSEDFVPTIRNCINFCSLYYSHGQTETQTLAGPSFFLINNYNGNSITVSTEVSPSSTNAPTATVTLVNGQYSLSLSSSPSTPNGTYIITILGSNGTAIRETFVSLLVGFDFSLTDLSVQAIQGSNGVGRMGVIKIFIDPYPSSVDLSCTGGLPTGVSCSFNPVVIAPGSTSGLTISTTLQTPLGYNSITIVGTGGGVTHTANLWLLVIPYDYKLWPPNDLTVSRGSSAEGSILVSLVRGTPQSVSLSCQALGLPAGVSCRFRLSAATFS